MNITSLGIEVDSTGVKTATTDLEQMARAGERVEASMAKVGETGAGMGKVGDAARSANAAIEKHIAGIQRAAITYGKGAIEAELLTLKLKGATEQQLKYAEAALREHARLQAADKQLAARTEAIKEYSRTAGQLLVTALATASAAAIGAFVAFDKFVKSAGQFQEMAERTGDTAENIASLAVAASATSVSVEQLVSASAQLMRRLTGVSDEANPAGAALKALGINIASFKKLGAADQLETIAKAMSKFKDNAKLSEIAMALWRESGTRMLPVMKELADGVGRQVILTNEQIAAADKYADNQAQAITQFRLHAAALATQMLPAYTAFIETMTEAAKEVLNLDGAARDLGKNGELAAFAQEAALTLAHIVDIAFFAAQSVRLVGRSFGIAAAIAANPSQYKELIAAAREEGEQMKFNLGFADKLGAKFAAMNKLKSTQPKVKEKDTRPDAQFEGRVKSTAAERGRVAKAALAADVDAIKNAASETVEAYANAEKIISELHAAGLIDDSDYFQKKISFLKLNSDAQEHAILEQIDRYKREKLAGSDRIENDKKIAGLESDLAKLRANRAVGIEVLNIKETAALKNVSAAWRAAEAAAQDYLDTIIRAQQVELAGAGKGSRERDRLSGRAQIEDKYSTQRQALELQRRQAEMAGTFTGDVEAKYSDDLARINEFQSKALNAYDDYYEKRLEQDRDWSNGASEAMNNYLNEADNVAKQTEDLFSNAFKNMEDALVSFVTTGKLDFSKLVDSMIADFARLAIRQTIMAPLVGALFGSITGRASGGPVNAGGIYRVNENGPELLNVAGKQYLMMGQQSGSVSPNSSGGSSQRAVVNIYNSIGSVASQSDVVQGMKAVRAQIIGELSRGQRMGGAWA